MVGFTITSLLRPSLSLPSNSFPFSSSTFSFSLKPQPFISPNPQSLLVSASNNNNNNNNNSELREKGNKQDQQKPTDGSNGEEDVNNNNNSSKQKRPIFSFNWSTLFDPDPDNVLALGLTGLLTWASVQVLWQLLFISFAILLAALKYSFIAALLIFILITLL